MMKPGNSKITIGMFILLLAVFFINTTTAKEKGPPVYLHDSSCAIPAERNVVDLLMNDNIELARAFLDAWQKKKPDDIKIPFYHATVIFAMAEFAKEDKKQKKELLRLIRTLKKGMKKIDGVLKHDPVNRKARLVLGLSQSLTGLASLKLGRWFQAYKYGRKGRDTLRKLLEQDRNLWDAYHILGVYEYYTGSVPVYLKWLTAILDLSGNVKKGVNYLEKSVKYAPTLGPESARFLLDGIYSYDVKHFCHYLPLAQKMRVFYPNNKSFSIILQKLLIHCGYPRKALKEIEFARQKYLEKHPGLKDLLNRRELFARRDLMDIEWIEKNKPLFKGSDIWQFSMAQLQDIIGQRLDALKLYKELVRKRTEPDWVRSRAKKFIKQPYRSPGKLNGDRSIQLLSLCEQQ